MVSGGSHSVYKCKEASCGGKRTSIFRISAVQFRWAIFSDFTALAYLRKQGGTRSTILNAFSQRILHGPETIDLVLAPQFFRGQMDSEVGGVPPVNKRGPVFIDLFAISLNHCCSLSFRFPRPLSNRYGCASSELGRVSGVYFSTVVNDTAGSEEAPLISWGPHGSSCSILAPEALVPRPSRPRSGRSDQSSGVSSSPEITTFSLPAIRQG